MTRKQLRQYRALKKEVEALEWEIVKLHDQCAQVPTVAGKVQSSEKEFPYIEEHVTVLMDEPRQADMIKKRILIKNRRMKEAEEQALMIEKFIARIPDSRDRQIFELVFIEGKTHKDAAVATGYSRSRVTQRISEILKD